MNIQPSCSTYLCASTSITQIWQIFVCNFHIMHGDTEYKEDL
jgi:hypothetical protein